MRPTRIKSSDPAESAVPDGGTSSYTVLQADGKDIIIQATGYEINRTSGLLTFWIKDAPIAAFSATGWQRVTRTDNLLSGTQP